MKRLAIALLFAGLASPAPYAQDKRPSNKPLAPDGVIWVASWEDAVKEAKARNVPIHVALHKDN